MPRYHLDYADPFVQSVAQYLGRRTWHQVGKSWKIVLHHHGFSNFGNWEAYLDLIRFTIPTYSCLLANWTFSSHSCIKAWNRWCQIGQVLLPFNLLARLLPPNPTEEEHWGKLKACRAWNTLTPNSRTWNHYGAPCNVWDPQWISQKDSPFGKKPSPDLACSNRYHQLFIAQLCDSSSRKTGFAVEVSSRALLQTDIEQGTSKIQVPEFPWMMGKRRYSKWFTLQLVSDI